MSEALFKSQIKSLQKEPLKVTHRIGYTRIIAGFRKWVLSNNEAQIGTEPFLVLDGKTKSASPV
jgi:hypothetical protein